MHLSDTEKAIVERLRKRQECMIRWRWVGLIGALVYIGAGCYGLALLLHPFPKADTNSILMLTCLLPIAYGLVAMGVGLLVYLCLRWNGNPETRLLLRLIEDSQHDR
jgi:hypothetical protein